MKFFSCININSEKLIEEVEMSWVERSLFVICNLIIFYSQWDYFSLPVKSSLNQNDILQSIKEYETDN